MLRHYAGIEYFLSSVPYLEHHNIMITNPKLLSIEWLLQWCQHGKNPLSNEKTTSQLKERLLPILFQSEKNDALAMLYFLEVSQENRIEAECFFYEASQAITRLCSDVANTDHTIVLQRLYNKRYLLPPVLNKHLVKSLDKAEETKDNQKNRIKSASLYSSIRRNAFSSSIPHSQHLAYEMNAFDLKEHFENKISARSLGKTITQIIAAITPTIAGAAILAPLSMIDLGLTIILGILITILTINLGVLALMLVDHAFGPEPILERPKLPSQDVDFSIDIFSKPGASPFPSAPPIATAIALNELEEQAYQATAVQNKSFYR